MTEQSNATHGRIDQKKTKQNYAKKRKQSNVATLIKRKQTKRTQKQKMAKSVERKKKSTTIIRESTQIQSGLDASAHKTPSCTTHASLHVCCFGAASPPDPCHFCPFLLRSARPCSYLLSFCSFGTLHLFCFCIFCISCTSCGWPLARGHEAPPDQRHSVAACLLYSLIGS